jgi:hypothetical protein
LCDYDVSNLARKLAEKWHLTVTERRSLPIAGLPASAFVEAIRDILKASPWYPSDWPRDEPAYDGAVITPNEHGFMIHERHEIGMMRFSDAMITQVATLEEAVRAFLKATFKTDDIDGIPIDWSR